MKRYQKRAPFYINNEQIGFWDELYFAPLEMKDIVTALVTYKSSGHCPIIVIHIDGLLDNGNIEELVHIIQKYNYSIGYKRKICIEFRLRQYKDLAVLYGTIDYLRNCRLSLVLNYPLLVYFDKTYLNYLDFFRVNYYNEVEFIDGYSLLLMNECYKLARVSLSNLIDYEQLSSKLFEYGFNGMQVVKGHDENNKELLTLKQKKAIENLKRKTNGIDVFFESNIDQMYQPIFCLRKEDYGDCLSSLLCLTLRNSEVMACPYNNQIKAITKKELDECFPYRVAVNSVLAGCSSCGYISDNNLYRIILSKLRDRIS